jgi:hypothetical protein
VIGIEHQYTLQRKDGLDRGELYFTLHPAAGDGRGLVVYGGILAIAFRAGAWRKRLDASSEPRVGRIE